MRRPFSTQTDDPLEAMLLKFVRVLHGLKSNTKRSLRYLQIPADFQNIIFVQYEQFNSDTKCWSWDMRKKADGRGDGTRIERWKGEREGK